MAIVADIARTGVLTGGDYNTTYQKGNDDANTDTPTWLQMLSYPDGALITETHVNFAYETGTNNTADAWVPLVEPTFLTSTSATIR